MFNMKLVIVLFVALFLFPVTESAAIGNPYLPLWEHLPDGEPRVFEDPDHPGKYRAYIIGSHDVRFGSYCGADIRAWSAPVEDLTDWRDDGPIFTYSVGGQWDVMYAPDLVEVKRRDGTKEYYLFPHSRGPNREAMVAKGSRPDGPFTPVNLTADGQATLPGSILGFDPSIYIEYITDPADPDYEIGFRAYGFWGFQRSMAAQLDQNTMYSVRPGTEIIPYFMPSGVRYGELRDPKGTEYPHIYPGEDLGAFNFFEASSIRKVGNKYVSIYSGYSGPDYGLSSTNSALRYAYGDSPLGPWKSGGVLVDSRAPVLNEDGSALQTTFAGHNTHGSIQLINDRWYAFYHRPPRGFGNARQAMVAPLTVEWDEKSVAEGGKVTIRAYDPYAKDQKWTAKDSHGKEYTGAEVTSEGFQFYGLDPYQYYSAGYACYLSDVGSMQDSWEIWDNHMPVTNVKHSHIIGFKYFGFGGLKQAVSGLKPFEGTKPGNNTAINLFITPKTNKAFKVNIWLDGPWDNNTWKGKKIGEINVAANSPQVTTQFTADVSAHVDGLDKKHAIYLVAEGTGADNLFDLIGLGFSSKNKKIVRPTVPTVTIRVNGRNIDLPATPVRSTNANGIVGYDLYEATCNLPANTKQAPAVTATASHPDVKVSIVQAPSLADAAVVKFDYKGMVKTYKVKFAGDFLNALPGENEGLVNSPDGNLQVQLSIRNGRPTYSVNYNGKVMLEASPLGLVTGEGDLSRGMKFVGKQTGSIDRQYEQEKIKKSAIAYRANALTYIVENERGHKLNITFQVSNNDIAFRYELPAWGERLSCVIEREATGYKFPSHATTFLSPMMRPMVGFGRTSPSYESGYSNDEPFAASHPGSEGYVFPGLFRIGNEGWVLLSETGVDSRYCASHLSGGTGEGFYTLRFPNPAQNNGFGSSSAQMALPGATPWRTITVGETLKPIVETTIPFDVVEPLYQPSQPYKYGRGTWSWIVWQDQSMNRADQMKYIDLAAELGYEYILMDALWDRNIGYDGMKELIKYANARKVDVFLWYNSNGSFNDAPQSPKHKMNSSIARKQEMKWLKEAGVKGLKVDFFGGDKQETMRLYEDILSDANDHGLMIIFHGCTLPRGWERMYPNYVGSEAVLASEMLIFSEGVRKDEAFYATLHPFIRNTVGSMEFGGVLLNKFLNRGNQEGQQRLTTDAFQLATAILFQNPVQMFALTPNNLTDVPAFEIDFMKQVPTTWNETLYIDGYPGKYAVIARRHAHKWYVAGINAKDEPLKLKLKLPMFAGQKVNYYHDDKQLVTRLKELTVKKGGEVEVVIQPKGGVVIQTK